jgi:hypothetical protein
MKNVNDFAGNKTRDLAACSEVPQTTAPLSNRLKYIYMLQMTEQVPLYVSELLKFQFLNVLECGW